MSDYYSSSLSNTQTPSSSTSHDYLYRSRNRARRQRRQTLTHGPRRPAHRSSLRASLSPYSQPLTARSRRAPKQPLPKELFPSSTLIREIQPRLQFKPPTMGELMKMYSLEEGNKRRRTRKAVPAREEHEWSSRREIYEDDEGIRCVLVPGSYMSFAALVGFAIVLSLGGAAMLLRNTAHGIQNRYGGSYGRQAKAPTKMESRATVVAGHTELPRRPMCATDSCLWQRQYLLGKLNWSVQPCDDFYSYVCSQEWYKTNGSNGLHQPFVFKESAATMLDLWYFLNEQPVDVTSSFASQASLIIRGCSHESKGDKEWTTFRKIFLDLGIQDWPYERRNPFLKAHDVIKVADKLLGLSTFVSTSLRENSTGGQPSLYVDSPPILLRRYRKHYLANMGHKYEEFVFKAMSLWKTTSLTTAALAQEVVRLEDTMSNLAGHSVRSVPITHVIRQIDSMPAYPNWDWHVYFSYFLYGEERRRPSGEVVLLDPAYFDGLSALLTQLSCRALVNYAGYKLLVNLSPLLPGNRAHFVVPLSHQYHLVGGAPDRLQACMFLLERLYPFGTRSLIWTAMLTNTTAILSDGLADDLRLFGEQARSEMKRFAADASWMTQDEAATAVFKIERMNIVLTPSKEELAFLFEPFELPNGPNGSNRLATYYNLLLVIRSRYWSDMDPQYFREPRTPTKTSFLPGFAYDPVGNTLTVSPATVALVSAISRRLDARAVPFLLSYVLQGMFSAMDSRGCAVDAVGDIRKWWTSNTTDMFIEKTECIQDTFATAAVEYVRGGVPADIFREENVMTAAVLRPMYNIFRQLDKDDGPFDTQEKYRSLNSRKLFFVNWATTLCEPQRGDRYHQQSIAYKLGVPGELAVNVALSQFAPFSEAFECPPGSPIKSAKPCSFW